MVVVSSTASVAPGPPCAPVARTVTAEGFDAGQYSTLAPVNVCPAPTVTGTEPATVLLLKGPPIQPCTAAGEAAVSVQAIGTALELMLESLVLRTRARTESVPGFVPE
jgi:hypothetical protein